MEWSLGLFFVLSVVAVAGLVGTVVVAAVAVGPTLAAGDKTQARAAAAQSRSDLAPALAAA